MATSYLTDSLIKSLEGPTEISDSIKRGLSIRVSKTGIKTFTYRYRFNGRIRRYNIGRYPEIRLADARGKAGEIYNTVKLDGRDPLDSTGVLKFSEILDLFMQLHAAKLKAATQVEYGRMIRNEIRPAFGDKDIELITRQDIARLLGRISGRGSKIMSNRYRSLLRKIFNFAISKGLTSNEFNPVTRTEKETEAHRQGKRVYDEDELCRLWAAFNQQPEPQRSLLKVLLLTAQRSKETRHMMWSNLRVHIIEKKKPKKITIKIPVWTIPGPLAKNSQEHTVPLAPAARQIIEDLRPFTGSGEYVFESPRLTGRPIEWVKRSVHEIKQSTGISDFKLHDLRRTAATNMAELHVDRTVLGKLLNHKGLSGDNQVTAIYDRHDYMEERAQALDRWAHRLDQIVSGEQGQAKVTKIA
ncbi:MAG: tyrosine-type recombinase/integrase [Cyclonatronaceae bacterium]